MDFGLWLGPVTVDSDAWIAACAVLAPGIVVGEGPWFRGRRWRWPDRSRGDQAGQSGRDCGPSLVPPALSSLARIEWLIRLLQTGFTNSGFNPHHHLMAHAMQTVLTPASSDVIRKRAPTCFAAIPELFLRAVSRKAQALAGLSPASPLSASLLPPWWRARICQTLGARRPVSFRSTPSQA